jgi:DTW domain-containing protein
MKPGPKQLAHIAEQNESVGLHGRDIGSDSYRSMCYVCHKAKSSCICVTVRQVSNRIPVWILQHPREKNHPIGSAKIAKLSLSQCHLLTCGPKEPRYREFEHRLPPQCALVYPSAQAIDVNDLAPGDFPQQILLLDATWSHSYAMYKNAPWLSQLPHIKLKSPPPSRYRIRKEPRIDYISTLETIVEVMRVLDPHNDFSPLIHTFDHMIENQANFQQKAAKTRKKRPRTPKPKINARTLKHLENALLIYVETIPHDSQSYPIYVTAYRPRSGDFFQKYVAPPPNTAKHIMEKLMTITPEYCSKRISKNDCHELFNEFKAEGDVPTAWNQKSLDALSHIGPRHLLKATYCNLTKGPSGHLNDILGSLGLTAQATPFPGRANERMGATIALHQHLLKLARVQKDFQPPTETKIA